MNHKKIIMSILFCIVFLLKAVPGLFAATGISGDVNDNGKVDIIDALATAQYSVGLPPAVFVIEQADVNTNGKVDIVDALVIARYYVGLIPSLPYVSCYTLVVSPADIVCVSPVSSCYDKGTTVTLSAPAYYAIVPPPGTIIIGGDFYFNHWEDGAGNKLSTDTTIQVVMDSNKTIKAVYDQIW